MSSLIAEARSRDKTNEPECGGAIPDWCGCHMKQVGQDGGRGLQKCVEIQWQGSSAACRSPRIGLAGKGFQVIANPYGAYRN